MKAKFSTLLLAVLLVVGTAAGSGWLAYNYLNQDLTGMSAEDINAFKEEHPKVNVTYTVTIEGGSELLELAENTSSVKLENAVQVSDLVNKSAYLYNLSSIDLSNITLTPAEAEAVQQAFPHAQDLIITHLSILGSSYPLTTEEVDLSSMTPDMLDTAVEELKYLPALSAINLMDANGGTNFSMDDALKLKNACPDITVKYAFDLLGVPVSHETESLEYARRYIGDAGVDTIRKALPLMPKLSYLKLDDCGTTDETMAQLRADFPNIEVHWRIFYSVFDCMTDNYKLWTIGGLMDKQIVDFVHLRGLRYLDLGHNCFTHLDFMKDLKYLDTVILAHGTLEDISGIKDCSTITFLEIFSNRKLDNEDMQNLSGLVNMEYLNISNLPLVTDLSFTDNMPKLKKLWCTLSNVPQSEIDRVKALHPDCEFVFMSQGDPTDYGWRKNPDGSYVARYALLREQIGYERDDVSQYPKGELKELITYESTGITPDE